MSRKGQRGAIAPPRSVHALKQDGAWNLRHSEDVGQLMSHMAVDRELFDQHGFGDGYQRACRIPEPVAIEIKEKLGIDVLNLRGAEHRTVLNYMRRHYPKFMAIDPGKRW